MPKTVYTNGKDMADQNQSSVHVSAVRQLFASCSCSSGVRQLFASCSPAAAVRQLFVSCSSTVRQLFFLAGVTKIVLHHTHDSDVL